MTSNAFKKHTTVEFGAILFSLTLDVGRKQAWSLFDLPIERSFRAMNSAAYAH